MDATGEQRARELRLVEGLSAGQIGERLGVPARTVARWIHGLPVPAWTRRPNAKDQVRARAVALRAQGWSVPDIARELGVARSTAWLWVREQPLDPASERARAGHGAIPTVDSRERGRRCGGGVVGRPCGS
jgi:transcriptional regulator with XRE-family HTH domain